LSTNMPEAVERKAESLRGRYKELLEEINAASHASQSKLAGIHEELGRIQPTVENVELLAKLRMEHSSVTSIANDQGEDEDLRSLAQKEGEEIQAKIEEVELEVMKELLPKSSVNAKGLLLEIRAGTGGEEAALFSVDLFQMYQKFAAKKRWKFEVLSVEESGTGGYKEAIVEVSGKDAFELLQFESGIHRVQRVPQTESGGRVHTSASTVAVIPQAAEVDFSLKEAELKVESFRSGGAGGQHVNTTNSAVRVTHLPTGISVSMQDERSQHQNRAKAMKILRARLYDESVRTRNASIAAERKSQVGSGDRSERIRTYNFQQGRVTDHRVNLTLYQLDVVLAGEDLQVVIDALQKQSLLDRMDRLADLDGHLDT